MSAHLPTRTRAVDWFADEREFCSLLSKAREQATGVIAEDFSVQMQDFANQFGLKMYLSEKQLQWLCMIAGRDIPPRRDRRGDRR
jgi:hypothetical protein